MSLIGSRMLLGAVAVVAASTAVAQTQYSATRLQSVAGYSVADVRGISNGKAVGFASFFLGNGYDVPVVWDIATGTAEVIPLPGGFAKAIANGIDGGCIAGSAFDGAFERAICWNMVNGVWTPEVLDAGGSVHSVGYGVSGTTVVGGTVNFFPDHAALWGPNLVNLSPDAGMAICNAIAGDVKVGRVDGAPTIWDSANTATSLAMADTSTNTYVFGEAYATNGTQHGGYVDTDQGIRMAAIWQGGALTTLHQPSWLISMVRGMNATTQVGSATTFDGMNYNDHAFAWSGNPNGVDLHQYLPTGYVSSNAYAIDGNGNIVGTANTASGEVHAFIWRKPGYTFSPFCEPVNDPAEPPTVVRRGAVIPLAIKVFDSAGNPVNNVNVVLTVTQLGDGGGPVNTDVFDTAFDIGPYFRFVGFGINKYMYLMSTRELAKDKQYKLTATVEGTNDSHSVVIGVR